MGSHVGNREGLYSILHSIFARLRVRHRLPYAAAADRLAAFETFDAPPEWTLDLRLLTTYVVVGSLGAPLTSKHLVFPQPAEVKSSQVTLSVDSHLHC